MNESSTSHTHALMHFTEFADPAFMAAQFDNTCFCSFFFDSSVFFYLSNKLCLTIFSSMSFNEIKKIEKNKQNLNDKV